MRARPPRLPATRVIAAGSALLVFAACGDSRIGRLEREVQSLREQPAHARDPEIDALRGRIADLEAAVQTLRAERAHERELVQRALDETAQRLDAILTLLRARHVETERPGSPARR